MEDKSELDVNEEYKSEHETVLEPLNLSPEISSSAATEVGVDRSPLQNTDALSCFPFGVKPCYGSPPQATPLHDIPEPETPPPSAGFTQHYQVKWSKHPLRLVSYVGSLQGDVTSSDMTIASKDGSRFYAHQMVLASASEFLKRTFKNISREDHVVLVIPKSSQCISAFLTFCYKGIVDVPISILKDIFEIGEDYQMRGLQEAIRKETSFDYPPLYSMAQPKFPSYLEKWQRIQPIQQLSSLSTSLSPSPTSQKWNPPGGDFTFLPASYLSDQNMSPNSFSNCSLGSFKRIKTESFSIKSGETIPISAPSPLVDESSNDLATHSTGQTSPLLKSWENPNPYCYKSSIIPQYANPGSRILLWRFLLDLLHDREYSPHLIKWIDRKQGIFRIMDSDSVANLWGAARKNTNMTYEKMSRGMRTYYKRQILFHLDGTKLIYRFNTSDPGINQQLKYYDLLLQNPQNPPPGEEQGQNGPTVRDISSSENSKSPQLSPNCSSSPSLKTEIASPSN